MSVKRVRRTKAEIDKNIDAAMEKLVAQKGFSGITLLGVAQEAQIETPVLYNKYGGLDGLLEAFTKKYEYWINDVFEKLLPDFNTGNHEAFIYGLFRGIGKKLYKDRVMQQLLIWEVQEKNHITDHSAKLREDNSRILSQAYELYFKDSGISFNAFSAIIIGGIYYLILHKDASTFGLIDFSTKEGEELLFTTIDKMCDMLFAELNRNKQAFEIARKLKERKVDITVIAESTGLTEKQINEL